MHFPEEKNTIRSSLYEHGNGGSFRLVTTTTNRSATEVGTEPFAKPLNEIANFIKLHKL